VSSDERVISPRWYRRAGLWIGLGAAVPSLSRLPWEAWVWLELFLVAGGAALVVVALGFQHITVDDRGVRTHRLTHRRRRAGWDEIDQVRGRGWDVPRLTLHDGSELKLTDWAGDTDRVVAALTEERGRRSGQG
jgi:hypothetical protein